MNDLPLFDQTDGFVNRPASKDRAIREATDGTRNQRHKKILKYLMLAGPAGATWRQMGEHMGLHHGQISGALSKLHKEGAVFALRTQRDRCHPYVHSNFKSSYMDNERFDDPVRTANNLRLSALEELFRAVDAFMLDDRAYIQNPEHFNRLWNCWKAVLQTGEKS